MNKSLIITISIIICVLLIIGIFFITNNNSKTIDNEPKNTLSYEQNILNDINNFAIPNNSITGTVSNIVNNANIATAYETEIANFSTDLAGDTARLNNINITCLSINDTTVKPGDVFSFNSIVGMPSSEKGYMEADVIVGTKVEKGFGGGNCQVSTTIYNACLSVPGFEIIERNPHKKKVAYIEEGKDASVSYSGNLDFKFKNNTGSTIKIYTNSDDANVNCRIVKINS